MRKLWIVIGCVLLTMSHAAAEKRWQLKMQHPPILGEGFAGAKVVFGQVDGRCAKEFTELFSQDLQAHGISVVPRLEKPTGAMLEIAVNISRCEALPKPPMLGPGLPAVHISRTEGHFLASLQVLDLATGDGLASQTLRADPYKDNESQTGNPEHPAPAEIQDLALRQAIGQTRRLHTAWRETQEISFMDDKDCNLKQAFEYLKAGDYGNLIKTSQANAEACQSNPKTAPSAWYNLGVAHMLGRNYDAALTALAQAQKLRNCKPVEEALSQCKRNKELAGNTARHVVAWVHQAETAKPGQEIQTGIVFTNDLVIRLVQGNVAEEDIAKMIATQIDRFSLDPANLAELKQAGVPDRIIAAMQARRNSR